MATLRDAGGAPGAGTSAQRGSRQALGEDSGESCWPCSDLQSPHTYLRSLNTAAASSSVQTQPTPCSPRWNHTGSEI